MGNRESSRTAQGLGPGDSRFPTSDSRAISGILLLDKPSGASSNQVLQRVRRLFGADKAGHTGSLDPLATGLLPICFGEATKIAGLLLGSRKAYETACLLGITTTTDDAEGETVERRPVPPLDDGAVRAALAHFCGRIVQVPPIYSALKQDGVPLYRRARRGETVEAPSREVDVDRFELIERDGDRLRLRVECGSGTYVRSLVRDLGERLGCGAHVTSLRRTWVEPFREPAMLTFERLEAIAAHGPEALEACLLPLERGLAGFPRLEVSDEEAARLNRGQRPVRAGCPPLARACAFDPAGRLVALVEVAADGAMRVLRGFNREPGPLR